MPDIVAQLVLTPLLAGWSTWVGIAISVRSSDVRVAQQLSLLANLPLILLASLIAFDTIHPTPALAIGLTSVLLIADALGWRVVAPMFDRERLITGHEIMRRPESVRGANSRDGASEGRLCGRNGRRVRVRRWTSRTHSSRRTAP